MINYRFQRDGLNRPNGSNGLNGVHGASGLRGHGALSFIMYSLLFIISATCFSACCSHSDDTPEPTPQPSPGPTVETGTPISFSGQETEAQDVSNGVKGTRAETRAGTPLSESGVTTFKVWGYKNMNEGYADKQEVFPGFVVKWLANSAATTTTNTNGWEYVLLDPPNQTIKYWDWSAKAYRFFAVTGEAAADATDLAANPEKYLPDGSNGSNGVDKFSFWADATSTDAMAATPFFSHLWFSTGNEVVYPDKQFGKPVVLEFLKPYARVRYMLIFSYESEGIKIKSQSFKPTNGDEIVRKGTFTVSYPLTGTETRESFSVTPATGEGSGALTAFTQEYIPDGGPSKEIWYYVLPNNTQGSYTMTLLMNNDPAKTAVVPAEYMQWLPGYSYTYIFKILEEGGVEIELVQAAVTPWTNMEIDRTVYNW